MVGPKVPEEIVDHLVQEELILLMSIGGEVLLEAMLHHPMTGVGEEVHHNIGAEEQVLHDTYLREVEVPQDLTTVAHLPRIGIGIVHDHLQDMGMNPLQGRMSDGRDIVMKLLFHDHLLQPIMLNRLRSVIFFHLLR